MNGYANAKFIRDYQLTVQVPAPSEDYVVIKPPFTLMFDITKDCLSSSSSASFQIYNLSPLRRSQIRKNINDFLSVRTVILQAGYVDNTAIVFNGIMQQAFSVRDGIDVVTQIEGTDWSFAFISPDSDYYGDPVPTGTTQKDIVTNMMSKALPRVTIGSIGNVGNGAAVKRTTSFSGMAKELIQQHTGGTGTSGFFIDDGVANILGQNECRPAKGVSIINSNSGLLGKPVQEANILDFEMLFEPRLLMGQIIHLDSVTEPQLSGDYKVVSIKHHGMISDAVCGDAITGVGLFSPHFPPQQNQFHIVYPQGAG
jgi:hypothetical protein